MRLVCISDTHGLHRQVGKLPEGDVLIHAGDLTNIGGMDDLTSVIEWMKSQPHTHKIAIAGNHDKCFEDWRMKAAETLIEESGIVYLKDSWVWCGGVCFWGSPYTPTFMQWSFMRDRGEAIKKHWDMIPSEGVDVLITHGPPYGVRDKANYRLNTANLGCKDLAEAVARVKPQAHIFGHIHGGYGRHDIGDTIYVNASAVDEAYHPVNDAIVIDIERKAFSRKPTWSQT